ncbi:MAG: hypothetical protein AAGA11_15770 [Pseudomonadota bacterium]
MGRALSACGVALGLTGCLLTGGTQALDAFDALEPVSVYAVSDTDLSLEWVDGDNSLAEDSALWESVLDLLPATYLRGRVVEFQVFSDGPEETLAYVAKLDTVADTWVFALDYVDAAEADEGEWVTTLTHEYAHIVALGGGELDGEASSCERSFAVEEGCALPHSLLLAWVKRFWPLTLQREHGALVGHDVADADGLAEFYERYPLDFVNEYAATNPVEDVAESFAYFVFLDDDIDAATRREHKVRFFYAYPELVALRSAIRARTPVRRASIDSDASE